ncbi:uncharacterized protein LOC133789808 [Humulus lupulus]|uniref:uncharacterized protein LOC133789808 n=1 Tax=Humulus lupulus TaxID=3486 RepID=UPI002B415808|nr:uncharacterized protein LOC133789808 [Humulus lupulus]
MVIKKEKPKDDEMFHCKCNPERVVTLGRILSAEPKKAVTNIGFGAMLDLKMDCVMSKLARWLVDQIDDGERVLIVGTTIIELKSYLFEHVIGIRDDNTLIKLPEKNHYNPYHDFIFNIHKKATTIDELEKVIERSKTTDKLFLMRYIFVVIAAVLCPTSGNRVKKAYQSIVYNVESIKNFNRVTHTLNFLCEQIQRLKQGEIHYIPDCSLFLQLMFMDRALWPRGQIDRSIPPIALWDKTTMKKFALFIDRK